MVAIQITAGTFGWKHDGKYELVPAGRSIDADEATAERLVSKGVAEFVSAAPSPSVDEPNTVEHHADVQSDDAAPDIYGMTSKELRELSAEYGLKFGVNARKAEMIAAIEAAYHEEADDAPSFDAAEAVQ